MSLDKSSTGLIQHTAFPGVALPAWLTAVEGDLNTGNLLPDEDCSFEGGTVGGWGTAVNCGIANDAANGYHCSHSLKQTVTANGSANTNNVVTALTVAGLQYLFAAKFKGVIGRQYQLAKWDNGTGVQYGTAVTADGTWQTATITLTFGAASTVRQIHLFTLADALAGDIVYWDACILKAGASAVPPTTLIANPVSVAGGECTIETDCDSETAFIVTTDDFIAYAPTGFMARAKAKAIVLAATEIVQVIDGANFATTPSTANAKPSLEYYNGDTWLGVDGTGNTFLVVGFAVDTYYIGEVKFKDTDVDYRFRDATTLATIAGCETLAWNYTYNNGLFLIGGEALSTRHATIVFDYFQLYLSNDITVTGLAAGNAVRIYNAAGVLQQSAVEAGGTATLDCEALEYPFTGYLFVFTDNTYTETLARHPTQPIMDDDIWGGDIYPFTGPDPIPWIVSGWSSTDNAGIPHSGRVVGEDGQVYNYNEAGVLVPVVGMIVPVPIHATGRFKREDSVNINIADNLERRE